MSISCGLFENSGRSTDAYKNKESHSWELSKANIFEGLSFVQGVVKFPEFHRFIQMKTGEHWTKSEARTIFDYLKCRVRSKKLPIKCAEDELPYEALLKYELKGKTLTKKYAEILETAKGYIKERNQRRKHYKSMFEFMGLDFQEKAFMNMNQFYNHIRRLNIKGMTQDKCDQIFYTIDKHRKGSVSYKELSFYRMNSSWSFERGLNNILEDGFLESASNAKSISYSTKKSRYAKNSISSIKQLGIEDHAVSQKANEEWVKNLEDTHPPAKKSSLSIERKQEQIPSITQQRQSRYQMDIRDSSVRRSTGYNNENDYDSKREETKWVTARETLDSYWQELDVNKSGYISQKEFIEWVRRKVPNIFQESEILYLFKMMDKNGLGQISKIEFCSTIDNDSGLREQLQHLLLRSKPMAVSSSSLSTKDQLFWDLPFDQAGNVKLENFREWFLRKLQEEECREVLDSEITNLFVHLGAQSPDDFLSAVDVKHFKRTASWIKSIDSLLKKAAKPSSGKNSKEALSDDIKEITTRGDHKNVTLSWSRNKRLLPNSKMENSVYTYTGKHIFDEISVESAAHITKKEFIHFVTEKWAWVNSSQAEKAFQCFTGGSRHKKLLRKKYFQKIQEAGGRSELDSFLIIIKADLSNAEIPIGNFCNYKYQQKIERQEKKIKDLSGWKQICKKEIAKWQTRSEIAEKQVIDLKVEMRELVDAFSKLEKMHIRDTRSIQELRKEIDNLRVVTFRVFDGIETNECGYVTQRQFSRWFVDKVPWAYPLDAVSLFNYVGNGAEEIDMETIGSYMYNTGRTSFHAKVKALLASAGPAPNRPQLLFDTLEYNFTGHVKLSEFYNWMREKAKWLSFVDAEMLFQYLDIEYSGELSRRELDKYIIDTSFDHALHKLVRKSGGTSDPHGQAFDLFCTTAS